MRKSLFQAHCPKPTGFNQVKYDTMKELRANHNPNGGLPGSPRSQENHQLQDINIHLKENSSLGLRVLKTVSSPKCQNNYFYDFDMILL